MSTRHIWTPDDIAGLVDHIDPDLPRKDWVKALAGIKDALGDAEEDIAREWSERSGKLADATARDGYPMSRRSGRNAGRRLLRRRKMTGDRQHS